WIGTREDEWDARRRQWVGGGVSAFDGYHWETFTKENTDPDGREPWRGLASNDVSAVAISDTDEIWIGTGDLYDYSGFGLSVLDHKGTVEDRSDDVWRTYTHSTICSNNITDLAIDRARERVWVATAPYQVAGERTGGGVSMFDGSAWTCYDTENSGLVAYDNDVRSIAVDSAGVAWIGAWDYEGNTLPYDWPYVDAVVNRFDGSTWTHYPFPETGWIQSITVDHRGLVWAGTSQAGLRVFDGSEWITYDTTNSGLASDLIQVIAVDPTNGDVWIGTAGGGVSRFHELPPTPTPTATPSPTSTPSPTPTPTPPIFPPHTRITLPSIVTGEGWETQIHVQNAGDVPTQVVMDLYAASTGQCPPKSPGVIGTLCSGPIKPGSTWTWTSADLPQAAASAIVYSVLSSGEGSACDEGTRKPGSPLAVTVDRLRTGEGGIVLAASSYTGIAQWGEPDPDTGNYIYFTPITLEGLSGWNTTMGAQNAGEACTSLKVTYQAQADGREFTFDIPALAPGEAVRIDPGDLVPPPFQGSAWIKSPQPLAVLVDQWRGQGSPLMSSTAGAWGLGAHVNYAPLIYRDSETWSADLQVQNLSATHSAAVKVALLDHQGDLVTTVTDVIPPRGSRTFSILDGDALPEQRVDALRVETVDGLALSGSASLLPDLLSRINLVNGEGEQGLSYNASPAQPEGGVGSVALPWLVKESGRASHIAIQNLNPTPGWTHLRLELYDQEGLQAVRLDRLGPNQTYYVDLAAWDGLSLGWQGSALVRVVDSSQEGGPAVSVVVVEEAEGAVGDLSRAYEGVPTTASSTLHRIYLPVILKGWAPAG
ncbi:MAG: hypothetical protein ACE5MB_11365, partial [Anaerolineae bacterium]